MFFLPLLYQAVDGLSAAQAGLLLIPNALFATSASLGGGFLIKRTGRYYWVNVVGWGLLLSSAIPMVLFSGAWFNSEAGTSVALAVAAIGAGSGSLTSLTSLSLCKVARNALNVILTRQLVAITSVLVALLSNAAKEDTAVVVACSYLFRSLGAAIGVSVGSAILQQVLRAQLASRLGNGDEAWEIERHVRESLDYIKELEPTTADIVRRCYQVATIHVFGFQAVPQALALGSALFIKEKSLDR